MINHRIAVRGAVSGSAQADCPRKVSDGASNGVQSCQPSSDGLLSERPSENYRQPSQSGE
ncbi:TPA: hypothetical protein WHK91_001167 [Neisseria meningitidis]|uniref:Putative lipoprotein n=1 Tax=Neisseria meningitidis serogroup B / serotype 15 (strain H44/76) TaxID=909420 RepID=E6N009_NEIMH|nr:hypothetical protein [Neisseria meningitidis]EFV62797.1 putative lipoprotein [Neisseria meningitidis H44/76]MBG8990017.1 hypothetical protein [Neisseria meningitidis]MBG8999926.1 hypothetical protein [Neisseria meningitidis]MBG9157805.1 hypothetical protein [Neisseria meningitidis]MBH2049397.1 hypothetical protein [Neisseria meningitidis]